MFMSATTFPLPPLDDEAREALLNVPASALDGILGTEAPTTYDVHRADGRIAHHALTSAIDRLRRECDGHPASTRPFSEDLQRLYSLLAPILHPWPSLRTSSPEATDRQIQDEWTELFKFWPAVELVVAPVELPDGTTLPSRVRLGPISVPGRGGTAWELEEMLSPAGMARIRGISRFGRHVYWRPAPGSPGAILVDDITDQDHPETPDWLRWAQPAAYLQTSRWKTQCIFVLPPSLVSDADALVAFLNRERGDPGVHAVNHWQRVPGCWNHKLGTPWCVRLLGTGSCPAMAEAWLAHEAVRMKREAERMAQQEALTRPSAPDFASRRPAPSHAQESAEGTPSRALPEPEDITENRNVEATRFIGFCFARRWGDAEGIWADALRWNARLPEPLSETELRTIHRSIQREDMEHHPERWRDSGASVPVRRRSLFSQVPSSSATGVPEERSSFTSKPKGKSASTKDLSEAELDALIAWHAADQTARRVFPGMPADVRLDMLRSEIRRHPDSWRAVAYRGSAVTPPLRSDGEDESGGPRR